MTNILRQILPNHQAVTKLHLAIERKPFLKRYLGSENVIDSLTCLDHYRHLRQLKVIYDTFSELLSSSKFSPALPESLTSLLQRGANIQRDLDFLRRYKDFFDKDDVILDTTQQYAAHLRQIENNNELLMHFLISILGDLNGGQFLKGCVQKLYQTNAFFDRYHPDNGVHFYTFEKNTAANLTAWLKTFIPFHPDETEEIIEDEQSDFLAKGAVDAFTMQAAIVDELEQTRISKLPKPSVAKNIASFFNDNSRWIVPATAAATATAIVGVVAALR